MVHDKIGVNGGRLYAWGVDQGMTPDLDEMAQLCVATAI